MAKNMSMEEALGGIAGARRVIAREGWARAIWVFAAQRNYPAMAALYCGLPADRDDADKVRGVLWNAPAPGDLMYRAPGAARLCRDLVEKVTDLEEADFVDSFA